MTEVAVKNVDPTLRPVPEPRRTGRVTVDLARGIAYGRFGRFAEIAKETGMVRPMRILKALNGGVDYGDVRIAIACLENVE